MIPAQFWQQIETDCLNMATFEFFFFKIWQLVSSFSSKYGNLWVLFLQNMAIFAFFWNKKKYLSTIRTGCIFWSPKYEK